MFILRIISTNGVEDNLSLGSKYTFVCRAQNPDSFRETFKHFFEAKHVADSDPESNDRSKECHGFVVDSKETIIPLWKTMPCFIMTDGGKTFANLSFR